MRAFAASTLLLTLAALAGQAVSNPPAGWVDSATGHRVVRLTTEPGSQNLYFSQTSFTASGDKMVFTSPAGLYALDWKTKGARRLIDRPVPGLVLGKKTRQAFWIEKDAIRSVNIDSGQVRVVAKAPPPFADGAGLVLNADETMLAGTAVDLEKAPDGGTPVLNASGGIDYAATLARRTPRLIYTIEVNTGRMSVIKRGTDWYRHPQFSPTDPGLLMFCHEGPWHEVDRIWTIRADGSGERMLHKRSMPMEAAGHELWSPDGKVIWYDLQTPRGEVFWLASHNLATGKLVKYSVSREQHAVHFNISWDGKSFAGDGSRENPWVYLYRPNSGRLEAEKLVDMAKHDYQLYVNATFTPDNKWIVFTSNSFGPSYIFAVEVAKAK